MKTANRKNRVAETKRAITIMSLLAAFAMMTSIGSVSAYLSGTDSETNTFTVGDVNIDLTEPSWDTDITTDLYPGQTLSKDPTIKNTGTNPLFAFIEVIVPKRKIYTYDPITRERLGPAVAQLFSLPDPRSGWVLIQTDDSNEENNVYIFAYGSKSSLMKINAGEKTPPVFDEVRYCYAVEGQELDKDLNSVQVNAYAIQSDNLAGCDTDDPHDVWNIVKNQTS